MNMYVGVCMSVLVRSPKPNIMPTAPLRSLHPYAL